MRPSEYTKHKVSLKNYQIKIEGDASSVTTSEDENKQGMKFLMML
jgi:hypothetical protein